MKQIRKKTEHTHTRCSPSMYKRALARTYINVGYRKAARFGKSARSGSNGGYFSSKPSIFLVTPFYERFINHPLKAMERRHTSRALRDVSLSPARTRFRTHLSAINGSLSLCQQKQEIRVARSTVPASTLMKRKVPHRYTKPKSKAEAKIQGVFHCSTLEVAQRLFDD